MNHNILLLTDSYKVTHWPQYPAGTDKVYSYLESRGGPSEETVFFGLQYLLYEYLSKPITAGEIARAHEFYKMHFGADLFNTDGWMHLLSHHDGKLPVEICAVPEGTVWPVHTPLLTIENTCPQCYWLTNYLETLLVQLWYPSTVASVSREVKKVIGAYLDETGDPANISFKLHDFGFRGVSSVESAALGGASHLLNFMGTDNVAALTFIQDYYANLDYMAGFSIPAAEHSTITSWGKDSEAKAYENMLDKFPEGLVAVVSDSYDIYNAVDKIWGKELKDKVLARNGTLVIRPDSGDPASVVRDVLLSLWESFGGTTNEKGYKVLDSHVRVIQGDGVNLFSIGEILHKMRSYGFSADNVAFGMGGALLQKVNRDTYNYAMKASEVSVLGMARPVFKSPVGDTMKRSTGGRKEALKDGINYLQPVFRNGEILHTITFDEVRKNAAIP